MVKDFDGTQIVFASDDVDEIQKQLAGLNSEVNPIELIEKNAVPDPNAVIDPVPYYRFEFFRSELTQLINKHSLENISNTPDFLLANYIVDCLYGFCNIVNKRDKWSK